MIKKNIIQYLLLIALVILSIFFYKKYIETDKDVSQKQSEIQKKYENPVNEENDETSNTIENLKYVSKDLLGNTYIITAQSAEIEENKVDRVQLVEVLAKIIQQDDEIIYINSNFADYNKINNNTVFRDKVNVMYGDQSIYANIISLDFSKNLIEIQEEVYFKNKNAKIKADKIELNFENKKLKISMDKQDDKVEIVSKY
ncbi:LPS export ABC transporter periplasmic protein LptC [Candidatus Pelagibacter sp.]|uniref:LPS export ABC transporter periplasmic protein LptC n=1 Tax=Candidatus Pelagibacter sp. TaxID=2024849 RepID=UPI003F8260FB